MTLQELREKRAKLVAEMRGILNAANEAGRDLNDDENAAYNGKKEEADGLAAQIKRLEDLEGLEAELGARTPTAAALASVHAGRHAPTAKKEFESLGEFLATVVRNPTDQRLVYVEGSNIRGEQRMDDGASGGYAIPTQFVGSIMEVPAQEAIVRPRATVIPAGSPPDAAITMPALDQTGDVPKNVYGGVAVEWVEEGGTKPSTEFKLRQVTLQPKEVAAHIPFTDKLLRNWQAASSLAERLLRGAISQATDDAFLNGNGVGKPLGILNSGAAKTVNRASGNKVKLADIKKMLSVLLMRGGQPIWVASQSIYEQLLDLKDDDGRHVWIENARDGSPGTLMGYRLHWNERSPLLGAKGDLSLLNLPYYLIKDGSGPFVSAGYANDDFIKNKQRLKVFFNVDGQPWLTEPFKQEKGFEVSPFVVLGLTAGSPS